MRSLLISLRFVVLMVLVCSVLYTGMVYLVGNSFFESKAKGSVLCHGEKAPDASYHECDSGQFLGSSLIGQHNNDPRYFWPRPSAAESAYSPKASGPSNLPYGSEEYVEVITQRYETIKKAHPDYKGAVPIDMITTSASGLDPHISPESAYMQAHRVAKARKVDGKKVWDLIGENVEEKQWGIFGARRVNVLLLNVALDEANLNE